MISACEALADAFESLKDGRTATRMQRVDKLFRSDCLFVFVLAILIFIVRTWHLRETQNPRQFYRRTAVRLGVWSLFIILGILPVLLYLRRKVHEHIYADLIIGTQMCRESDTFSQVCPSVCTEVQETKLPISQFMVTPSDTLVSAYLFFILCMGLFVFIFRGVRDLPRHRRPITAAEMDSILIADPIAESPPDVDESAQHTSNDNGESIASARTCSICLEELETGPVCRLSCTHRFHKICMQRWLEMGPNPTCPLCKAVLLPS